MRVGVSGSSAARFMRAPTRRFRWACCPRTIIGHAAAAPPTSLINPRRWIIRSPRPRAEHGKRQFDAKLLGRSAVDHEYEFRWQDDRKIGGLITFEDAARV